jgi:hypothetical protein
VAFEETWSHMPSSEKLKEELEKLGIYDGELDEQQ